MNDELNNSEGVRPSRRAFFGRIFSVLGSGLAVGSFLPRLLKSQKQETERERPVNITSNPLAVPRKKEGSATNG